MAGVTLGRDDPPVGRLVVAVVAAEAAEEVLVSDVVRVRTPGDLHVGPHVSPVNPLYLANRGLDGRAPGLVHGRILAPVEVGEVLLHVLERGVARRIRD